METLDQIINRLKEIRTITKTKVSDEVLFENAVKLFISSNINESKKENINNMKRQSYISPIALFQTKDDKPTDKQIAFFKKNKLDLPKTKKEAWKIMKNHFDNLKKENI